MRAQVEVEEQGKPEELMGPPDAGLFGRGGRGGRRRRGHVTDTSPRGHDFGRGSSRTDRMSLGHVGVG